MSALFYGLVTSKRVAAEPGKSQTSQAPGMSTYVDTLSALVPAEALALYAAVIVPNVIVTKLVQGKTASVISDTSLMSWSCIGLLALSFLLYVIGRYQSAKFTLWDVPRSLIPPAAFTAWMLLQSPSVFDVWWAGSSSKERVIIAAFAAVLLGILAKGLGYQADKAPASKRAPAAAAVHHPGPGAGPGPGPGPVQVPGPGAGPGNGGGQNV
jgi:hypothetical protein